MALQLWLPLNGDLTNNGLANATITSSGATVNTSGKIGSCYSFDGSDDYISITCSALYQVFKGGTQQFTIAFWVYHNDSTRGVIFGDYGITGYINFNIELRTTHGIRFYWNADPDKQFSDAVAAQGWTHIAIVYDGTKINLYKDGVLSGDVYTGVLPVKNKTSGAFCLGRDNRTGETALNGRLNDFRIYDTALSPREIKEISKGLVLHYPLNRGGFGQNNLYTGSKDFSGTWVNSQNWTTETEKYNGFTVKSKSTRWGGLAQNITCQNGDIYTISFYGKVESGGTIGSLHRNYALGNVTTGLSIIGGNFSSGAGWVTTSDDGTQWKKYWATLQVVQDDVVLQWRIENSVEGKNFCICGLKLERGSIATPWTPELIGQNNLFDFSSIASKWTAENCTVADYADSKYGNVLQMTTTGANQRIYITAASVWQQDTTYTVSFLARATTPIQCNMSRSIANFSPTFDLTTEWRRYTGVITTATVSGGTLSFRVLTAGTVYITDITLEKGDTTSSYQGVDNIEYDVSGYGHNGIQNGIVSYTSDTAKYNVSTVFNGTDTFIEAQSLPIETKTISIWLKTTWSTTSSYQIAVHDKVTGLAIGWTSGNRLITYVGASSGGSGSQVVTTNYYTANQWNHIVVVKTGDTTRNVYINGQLLSASSNNNWGGSQNKLNIGVRMYNNAYAGFFNGLMSDFRAYTTALSADDILELYNTPITLSSNGVLMTQGEFQEA